MYYELDIGGTKTVLDVSNSGRQLQWEERVPTPRNSYDAFLDVAYELIAEADRRSGYKGSVGIGIPGTPEAGDGTLYTANVPVASSKSLRADLNARLGRDVRLGNDANCFTFSEAWDDEFTQYPLVVGLILGTGIGGGLTSNGKPTAGKSYIIDESGHMRLPADALIMTGLDFPLRHCSRGQYGCIENYLSDCGFAWSYQHYYHRPLQAPETIALYDQGDEQTRVHARRYLDLLAVCLGSTLTIVDPDLVVISGGLSNLPAIIVQLAERLPRHLLPIAHVPRIERAHHGDAEGMRGAAFLHLAD